MAKSGIIPLKHAERFILSGRAKFSFYNSKTGNQFKYYVKEKSEEIFYVYSNITRQYLGYIKFRKFHMKEYKAIPTGELQALEVFKYVWNHITELTLPNCIQVMHTGQCGVCGRFLTDANSILTGIGPICSGKLNSKRTN